MPVVNEAAPARPAAGTVSTVISSSAGLVKAASSEEEEEALSWTSSSMSISPDHPLFHQKQNKLPHGGGEGGGEGESHHIATEAPDEISAHQDLVNPELTMSSSQAPNAKLSPSVMLKITTKIDEQKTMEMCVGEEDDKSSAEDYVAGEEASVNSTADDEDEQTSNINKGTTTLLPTAASNSAEGSDKGDVRFVGASASGEVMGVSAVLSRSNQQGKEKEISNSVKQQKQQNPLERTSESDTAVLPSPVRKASASNSEDTTKTSNHQADEADMSGPEQDNLPLDPKHSPNKDDSDDGYNVPGDLQHLGGPTTPTEALSLQMSGDSTDDLEDSAGLPLSRKNSEASSLSCFAESAATPWPSMQQQTTMMRADKSAAAEEHEQELMGPPPIANMAANLEQPKQAQEWDEADDSSNTGAPWPSEEEQKLAMEEAAQLLTHRRLPSTIAEENPNTLLEDEANSSAPPKSIQRSVLARQLQQTSDVTDDDDENDEGTKLSSFALSGSRASSSSTRMSYDNLQEFEASRLDRRLELTRYDETCTHPSGVESSSLPNSPLRLSGAEASPTDNKDEPKGTFLPLYNSTKFYARISQYLLKQHYVPFAAATWIGFWALLHVTCANYVLTPMRDAIALQVGVEHIPKLTLASTALAFCSSVPVGWLFEAPDPGRRRLWKRMGLTRGETQGTSLALFYRCFAFCLLSYAGSFQVMEYLKSSSSASLVDDARVDYLEGQVRHWWPTRLLGLVPQQLWSFIGQSIYVAFFLVVHLMKLHSVSLVWGVTTEAMEYEEVGRKKSHGENRKTRLQRMALVGFGGTLGGILGSILASSMAQVLKLPGLLVVAAVLFEVAAELAIELGRIMQKYWEEQQIFQSANDLASLDSSMKRSASMGSMKRVSSGNSLNRVRSATELRTGGSPNRGASKPSEEPVNEDSFTQRLVRGATTILRSRLLMSIFTYNALYASTTVLLSFQRAALVANRNSTTSVQADTAFLANINMASSVAIFALQATGLGSALASFCGPRGTLALMPLIRLVGVLSLAWWHQVSNGQPPNLLVFLVVDECTKIMNLAVAKPVRESLWRGLSNEARYEAKPIVDTLANRWGGGSAAFLVSSINKTLDLFGVQPESPGSVRTVFGFPPILVLCIMISAWWAGVSADLGQIRRNIDLELKKRQ